MSLASTSANDTAGGAGAQEVTVEYLDDALITRTEVLALSGLTPVDTVATDIRWVQTLTVTSGANTGAVGTISLTHAGTTYALIKPGFLDQTSSFRMVPAGHTGYVSNVLMSSVSLTADAYAVIRTVVYSGGLLLPRNAQAVQNGSWSIGVEIGNPIPAGALLGLTVTCNKAVTATGSFIGWVEAT